MKNSAEHCDQSTSWTHLGRGSWGSLSMNHDHCYSTHGAKSRIYQVFGTHPVFPSKQSLDAPAKPLERDGGLTTQCVLQSEATNLLGYNLYNVELLCN